MKHTLKITLAIIVLFFLTQLIGLAITNKYIDHMATAQTGNVTWVELPLNIERPDVEESSSYIYITLAILIGTIIILILIKTKAYRLWKLWFFLAILICLTIALAALIPQYPAFFLAFLFAFLKIYRPNVYIHNITETLVYGGLAAILVPIINFTAILILLAIISFYDMYAVWRSKHMIKMAKFQSESKLFAGLLIPYTLKAPHISGSGRSKKLMGKERTRNAMLGGGDIGFPLIFAGVVMKGLMLQNTFFIGFMKTLIIPTTVSIALLILLVKSKEDKFYPAMPFLSIGCIAGYLIITFISML